MRYKMPWKHEKIKKEKFSSVNTLKNVYLLNNYLNGELTEYDKSI